MGMSIDKAIDHGEKQLEIFGGEHKEFIKTALDTMRKYKQIKQILDDCEILTKEAYEDLCKRASMSEQERWRKGLYGMINANDYVGLTSYPEPIDYDGCGYEFGDEHCKECEHYRECERWVEDG